MEPWPLPQKPPAGMAGGVWIRNLGDHFGWGSDVYHIIGNQSGRTTSWCAMEIGGWREGMKRASSGEASHVGGAIDGEWRDGPIAYMRANRCPGQDFKVIFPSTKEKAMNRFS